MYDAIVIGSGLGGLTAAAELTRRRKKILVLEKHFVPGGCATVFTRKGLRMEVGLHEMDRGPRSRDIKNIIFEKLGLDKSVSWVEVPELWRIRTESGSITVPHGSTEAYLAGLFPEEKKGLRAYFRGLSYMAWMNRRFPPDMGFWDFFFYPITTLPFILCTLFRQESIEQYLSRHIKNERLKRILNINLGYFHDNPRELSWAYHASAQAGYYHSAYFIKGGSQALSNALVDYIQRGGGEVRLMAEAKAIITEKGKASGVEWINLRDKSTESARAKVIVAACAPQVVYKQLLPSQYEDKSLAGKENSISLYTVYLIFKKKFQDLYKGNAYSTFITSETSLNAPSALMGEEFRTSPVEARDFVFVDYSAVDSGLVPEGDGRSVGVLTSVSYLREWENLSPEDYKAKKELLAQTLFARLEKYYPGIGDYIEYHEVSTPKTIKRYINTPDGTAYGYKQNRYLGGRAPRVSPTVKNLHFAGAWNFPGGGFTGAMLSGYIAALNIIFPLKWYIFWRILLCIAVGTLLGTAHLWISALRFIFQ